MKTVAKYSCFFMTLFLFASCQKEPKETLDPVIDPPAANNSIYLKMVITNDASFAPGQDTLDKFVFHYDRLKRLDSLDYYEYSPGTSGPVAHHYEKRFYKGDDALPYKTTGALNVSPGLFYYHTIFYTYQDSVIVSDSVIVETPGAITTEVTKFKSYGNGKFGQNVYVVDGENLDLVDSIISVQTWENSNLVTQLDTSFMAMSNKNEKVIREFDNHPNPFRRINPPYPIVTLVGFTSTWFYLQQTMSTNNEMKSISSIEGSLVEDFANDFQYRADGYPISSEQTWDGDKYKEFYIYEDLP